MPSGGCGTARKSLKNIRENQMTKKAKLALVIKALRSYAQEHYGWSAKYHPEDKENFDTLIDFSRGLENVRNGQASLTELQSLL
jgi:hypothetical protein